MPEERVLGRQLLEVSNDNKESAQNEHAHVRPSLKPGSPRRFLLDAEGAGDQPSGPSLPSAPGCTTEGPRQKEST